MNLSNQKIGWIFVAVQFIFIAIIIWLPQKDHWGFAVLSQLLGFLMFTAGIAIMITAAIKLGRGLTATPEPSKRGQLITTGLYSIVRHPIYTGLLLVVFGITLRSRNILILLLAIAFSIFLHFKANWEEQRLEAVYSEYSAYKKTTGKLFPKLG